MRLFAKNRVHARGGMVIDNSSKQLCDCIVAHVRVKSIVLTDVRHP